MNCPRCGTPAPDGANFCANCGGPLRRSVERPLEGERRVVTVLFCDVRGSTAMAERMDPEDWAEVMNGAFALLIDAIQRYDGTVARVMGDGLLAYFGAPRAHEDDPERAILAALEIRRDVVGYRDRVMSERGIPEFDVRIGVNTGLAVVGDVSQGIEYSAMGDAVNVAARLQQIAASGAIVIGESTEKRVRELFDLRPLGAHEVKGRTIAVEAFEVIGKSTAAPRDRVLASPVVGRASELATLREAIDDVRGGRGRIVALIGDAGLGKTRLIDEIHALWLANAGDADHWSEAHAQSYGQSRAYLLLRPHILDMCDASATDTPDTIRAKLLHAGAGEADMRVLERILAIEDDTAAETQLRGEEVAALVERLVREHLARAPGVFVFDDLQWGDPATLECLMRALALVDDAPILFVCTFRPDRQSAAWRLKQTAEADYPDRYVELRLAPLAPPDAGALVDNLLRGARIADALRSRILDKAEGNPLFLEEIVRSLVQDEVIAADVDGWRITRDVADVRLPETLQGLVAARIDRLDEETRLTLQAASVIGRVFPYGVLRSVARANGKLDRHLVTLERVELIREAEREDDRVFAFRHALTQEAAYESILRARRRELHGLAAAALAQRYGERADKAAVIGHHFAEAGDTRAVLFLRVAGDQALRAGATDEAIAMYTRAIGLARPAADASLSALYAGLGRAHELRGDFDAALATYEQMERAAAERGDEPMQLSAVAYQTTIYANPTSRRDVAKAVDLHRNAEPRARALGLDAVVARLQWNRSTASLWAGRVDEALEAGEDAITLARAAGERELLAFALIDTARGYEMARSSDRGHELITEGAALFREMGNRQMVADSLGTVAFDKIRAGHYEDALEDTAEMRRLSDETNNDWGRSYAGFNAGFAQLALGDYGAAIQTLEEAMVTGEKAGFIPIRVGPRAELALAYQRSGDDPRAAAHALAADDLARRSLVEWRAWTLVVRARLATARHELGAAAELLAEATTLVIPAHLPEISAFIGIAELERVIATGDAEQAVRLAAVRNEAQLGVFAALIAEWDLLRGLAARLAGDDDAAISAFEHGIAEAGRRNERYTLFRLGTELASTLATRGDDAGAAAARDVARQAALFIAISLERVGLGDAFLARSDAGAVLRPK